MHGTAFLKQASLDDVPPVVVLSGSQRALKLGAIQRLKQAIEVGDDDDSVTRFGKDAELKTVRDELSTVSMWGDRRMVIVEEADEFVTKNRPGLEKYVEKPSKKSVLVLDVNTWTKTTRLAKILPEKGLLIECTELKGAKLIGWLQETAAQRHDKQLTRDAAQLMTELAGNNLGLLEQELAKLESYVGERKRIGPEDVSKLVGGWKAETTWEMLGALRDGRLDVALKCCDKLLVAGEPPLKILGGMAFVYRKLARATELARQGRPLKAALAEAGLFKSEVASASNYLRRIGRPQAEQFYNRLLAADAKLKGASQLPDRVLLEELLVELSGRAGS